MDKPIKPNLPYTDVFLRVPTYEPISNIIPHTDEHPGKIPNFERKEVPIYTKEQLLAYGQAMHLHGIAESRYIAEVYCDSRMIRFAKDVARALHDHFHHLRTTFSQDSNYDNTRR